MQPTLKIKMKKCLLITAKIESLQTTEEGLNSIHWKCLYKGLLAQEIFIQYENLQEQYELIIMDRYLPMMDALTFLTEYRELDPNTPVLVISHGFNLVDYHKIKSFANTNYCPKEVTLLKLSLEIIGKNEILDLNHPLIKQWVELTKTYSLSNFDKEVDKISITNFEQNLLKLLGEGKSIKEIAIQLKSSVSHIHHTKSKLAKTFGLKHNRLLLAYGVMYGYIDC
jgi:DNA-binding NarL/FixJ family response regulator